jgi:hypothetical protein
LNGDVCGGKVILRVFVVSIDGAVVSVAVIVDDVGVGHNGPQVVIGVVLLPHLCAEGVELRVTRSGSKLPDIAPSDVERKGAFEFALIPFKLYCRVVCGAFGSSRQGEVVLGSECPVLRREEPARGVWDVEPFG